MALYTALSWTSQLAMLRLPLVLVDELNCPPRPDDMPDRGRFCNDLCWISAGFW